MSLEGCMDKDGVIDRVKYGKYLQARLEDLGHCRKKRFNGLLHTLAESTVDGDGYDELQATRKTKRSRRPKGQVFYLDDDGERKVMVPTMSLWYTLYCNLEDDPEKMHPKFHKQFRRRFRMPYAQFVILVDMANESKHLSRWHRGNADARRVGVTPIELLCLTALRYLGRGLTFDDLSEATCISEETCRTFFHGFINFGSDEIYNKYVRGLHPSSGIRTHLHEYENAGFPGCCGSMDASHVPHERVEYRFRQPHLGHKLPYTARTYNIVVNHRREILSTTRGHPSRWNDKTLVRFDELATGLQNGDLESNFVFELWERGPDGTHRQQKYTGCWLIVDNGYLNWGTTIPPMKVTVERKEIRFSKWLESLRKDVECTFGILKGRWRVLKTGIRLHGVKSCDKIWLTCCGLHNWLLKVDGLSVAWESGVSSDWQGSLGETNLQDLPESIRNLVSPGLPRNFDHSGMGPGRDSVYDQQAIQEAEYNDRSGSVVMENGAIVVRRLSMNQFRERLVQHFDILFQKKQVIWPQRNHATRIDI